MKPRFLPFLLVLFAVDLVADEMDPIPAPQLQSVFETLDGTTVRPLSCDDRFQFATLIFITTDCPIANAFAPEMRRLQTFVEDAGGKLTLAYVDGSLSRASAWQHAQDYQLVEGDLVVDRELRLVKATGAQVTPEAVLVSPSGQVVYRGRISDLFADLGKKRHRVTREDLKLAIKAFVAGKAPPQARTEAVGCYIPGI